MDSDSDIDRLDDLAEQFVARYREGERPSLSEFIRQYPDLADQIRDLFPTLAVMEEARVASSNSGEGKSRDHAAVVPQRIGEYRILREIGRGGMGIVYEALQESLGRHVALKILPAHALLDTRQLQRFHREARSAARLHHSNIVPVFGVGVHEGLNFYVMQFIRGQGIDQVLADLKRSRSLVDNSSHANREGLSTRFDFHFPPRDRSSSLADSAYTYWLGVAHVGAQVADALAYANSQGVLHRDIKPSNLLLDAGGTVWVTDFGLAKDTLADVSPGGEAQDNLTRTGDIVGTLRYMAPERLKGHSDPRSDIYSLGATLYEMVTLRPAFDESDRNVFMRRLLHDDPPRPRSFDPTIPIDLETIVAKAMAKEPEDRYARAEELAEDLRRFLDDQPIRARRISTWERMWRICRRNPAITSLSLIVLLLIAVLTLGFQAAAWIRIERDRALTSAERARQAEQSSQQSLGRALHAERDAKARAHLTQAIVQRKRELAGRRIQSVQQIEAAMDLVPADAMKHELRNELVAALALTDVMPAQVWEGPRGVYAVDAQFIHYACVTRDGVISVRRMKDDREVRQLRRPPGPDSRASIKFSPDGKYLASFTFDQHVMVWQVSDGRLVLDDAGCCWEPSFDFTPDSRKLVVGHQQEAIVLDLSKGTTLARWPIEFAPWSVVCGPTENWVAITPEGNASSRKLQVYCWSNQKLLAELIAPKWVYDIAWHPTGKHLAFGCDDTNIYLWNVGSAKPYRKLSGSLAKGVQVAFSHDGALLASSSWGQEFFLWEPNTGEKLCMGRPTMLCLEFSPDDSQIALFKDGTNIGTYNISRSPIFRHFGRAGERGDGSGLLNAVFSRDGQLLMIGTEKGVSVYDYASGQERAFTPIGRTNYLCLDGEGNLLTSARQILRWPVNKTAGKTTRFRIGPPEQLPIPSMSEFDISRNGRVIIAADHQGATVFHSDRPNNPVRLSPHEDCRYVAVTRDGQMAATGSHFGSKVKVWETATGKLLATLPIESSSWVKFSPDGRWLVTTAGTGHIWKVGSWEVGRDIGGLVAGFSEDGNILAVDDLAGSVRLLDPESAREYVRLEHPQGYGAERYFFSPDGTELVAVGTARPSGFAWHLKKIREALSARGLDFDLPPFPHDVQQDAPAPVTVELISVETESKSREDVAKDRIARLRREFDANPDNATVCNDLAWELLFAPDGLREVAEAVQLATKALSLKPGDANYRNTLGVALYRNAQYREAVDCLAQNLPLQNDEGLPFDLYYLALSHIQLGDTERGQEILIWANRWSKTLSSNPEFTDEMRQQLDAIQREAALLMQAR